jgi:hypothetical protein
MRVIETVTCPAATSVSINAAVDPCAKRLGAAITGSSEQGEGAAMLLRGQGRLSR